MDLYAQFDSLIRHLIRKENLPANFDIDDIAQDVWLKVYQKKSKLDGSKRGAKSYLGKVVKSVIAETYSKNPITKPIGEIAVESKSPDWETTEEVEATLGNLSESERKVLTTHYLDGISKRRMARRSRTTRQKISSKIEKAKRRANAIRS